MLNRLQLRGRSISKYFHSIAQARPSASVDLYIPNGAENIFGIRDKIDEESILNTPSPFVADKAKSLFEKYKLGENDQFSFVELTLGKRIKLTHDTYLFKLDFPEEDKDLVMGTDIARAIRFFKVLPTKENPEGIMIKRYYTTSSPVDMKGSVEVPIKIYRANENSEFSEGGVMTTYLENMRLGDKILVNGPIERLQYYGNGLVRTGEKGPYDIVKKNHLAFVVGGSGITPYYRIIKDALENGDPTKFTLIYSNRTEDDFIFGDELEELALLYPHKFTYKKAITNPLNHENLEDVHIGRLTPEYLLEHLPAPNENVLVANMGPKSFNRFFANFILRHTSYDPITQVFSRDVDSLIF
ncbi:unnamed protein product [Moneuplotes crassus]|uniref:NADH-cytochrome b5 reductase n=1 Tax=Euplotes crassus TaxID=5936 RepID=A0AAD1XGW3_EUPCR|nr:unnamed protein product [Moneuplotes crassus]